MSKAAKKYPRGQDAIEKRMVVTDIELRGVDQGISIEGYAAVFDKLSVDLGGFREIISPGAFTRTLREGADVRALVDHTPSLLLGRNKAGTLTLREDDVGLRVKIRPPNTTVGHDTLESIRRGDIDAMSFAFTAITDAWRTEEGQEIRELIDVDLHDVSIVTFPAYTDTKVAVRSLEMRRSAELTRKMVSEQGRYCGLDREWTGE